MTDPPERSDRRRFLAAVGTAATATTLAGCNWTETTREFAATPYALGGEGMRRLGFAERAHEELSTSRELSVAGFTGELRLASHAVTYGHDATTPDEPSWRATVGGSWSAGVLSTPAATVAGRLRNPLATRPLSELLVGDRADRVLSLLGVEAPEWTVPPARVGSSDAAVLDREARVLDREMTVEVHLGVAETGAGPAVVAVYGTRVTVDGGDGTDDTAVLAGAVDRRPLPENRTVADFDGDPVAALADEERAAVLERVTVAAGVFETVGHLDEVVEPGAIQPLPRLSVDDPRIVQVSEDTHKTSGSAGPIPDPPIVVNSEAAAVFDLSGFSLDLLPTRGVEAEVTLGTTSGSSVTRTFRIPKNRVRDIVGGDSPAATFHELARDGQADTSPPVFVADYDGTATVRLVRSGWGVPYDTASWTFATATVPPLQVGFIEVVDPKGGTPTTYRGATYSYGDSNGRAQYYERSADSAYEYLRRAYPGTVVGFRLDVPLKANPMTNAPDNVDPDSRPQLDVNNQALRKDAEDAHGIASIFTQVSNFAGLGEIYHENVSRSTAETLIRQYALDVVVMVLPRGTASGNENYYTAHDNGALGLFTGTHRAVGSLESFQQFGVTSDLGTATTTAQEVGHYFADEPYTDSPGHPYARTTTSPFTGNQVADKGHANPDLVSVGYALDDGTFTVVGEADVKKGTFEPGAPKRSGGNLLATEHKSYMSYGGLVPWADNRITRYLVGSDYTHRYAGGASPLLAGADAAGATVGLVGAGGWRSQRGAEQDGARQDRTQQDGTRQDRTQQDRVDKPEARPVLEAYGQVEDGTVVLDRSRVFDGQPVDTEDVDTERRLEANRAEPVAVRLLGPDGEVLRVATVPDRVVTSHGGDPIPGVAVSLPFDERGVRLVAGYDGRETTLNALVHPLRDAVSRVPEHGFAAEPEAARERLTAALDEVAALVDDGAYDAAADRLSGFAEVVGETVRVEYEAFANEPNRERLLALAERMGGRLATLAEG